MINKLILLYIQLSFSVYLTCKWKGSVSYDTRPGTDFTWSGTIFSLVMYNGGEVQHGTIVLKSLWGVVKFYGRYVFLFF